MRLALVSLSTKELFIRHRFTFNGASGGTAESAGQGIQPAIPIEGLEDGFTVHDELLGVPEKDRGLHAMWSDHYSNRSPH